MTRIVSGTWRGRRLAVPRGTRLRPTAERVREAWLNILAPVIRDANVLDLCAGTGALGLEALSRGAAHATFVDNHAASIAVLQANAAALTTPDRYTVDRDDAVRFASRLAPGAFDIAFADPPFAGDVAARLAACWEDTRFATILAVEHPPLVQFPRGDTRRWGDIAVTIFRA